MSKARGSNGTPPKGAEATQKPAAGETPKDSAANEDGASGVHARDDKAKAPLRKQSHSRPIASDDFDDISWELDDEEGSQADRKSDEPSQPDGTAKPDEPSQPRSAAKADTQSKPDSPAKAGKPPRELPPAKRAKPPARSKPAKPPPPRKGDGAQPPRPGPSSERQPIPRPKLQAPPKSPRLARDEVSTEPPGAEEYQPPPVDALPRPDAAPISERGPRIYSDQGKPSRTIGRCELFAEIATGGMATIHLGRWIGAGGFNKPVAVKALHPQYAKDPEFVAMFLDEAQVVSRIRHPNVMPTIDLVEEDGELFIVMDYVEGVTLAYLMRKTKQLGERIPPGVALRIMTGVLHGLHAAHEAKDERGRPLCVIHRDVSPENVQVGVDGYARLIDFGIATALGRYGKTRDGELKGKLSYLSPEQIVGSTLTRQSDVFAAAIVLWQALTGRKLFKATNVAQVAHMVLQAPVRRPSDVAPDVDKKLDAIVMRGLERALDRRWETAEFMAEAIEAAAPLASHREVGEWVERIAGLRLERNAKAIKAMEAAPISADPEVLKRPMSIRPAPAESISEELVANLRTLRQVSDDLLKDHPDIATEVAPPEDHREALPDQPAPGTATASDEGIGDGAPDSLEWTGGAEPAEPVAGEASWQGVDEAETPAREAAGTAEQATPSLGDIDAAAAAAEATTATHDARADTLPPARARKPMTRRQMLIWGSGAFVVLVLVAWLFSSLGAYVAQSDTASASSSDQVGNVPARATAGAEASTTGRGESESPEPTASAATSAPRDAASAEAAEDAGSAAEEEEDAGAESTDAPDAASSIGKGRVPTAPWGANTSATPPYVPPDL